MAVRRFTHLNGIPLTTVFPSSCGCGCKAVIKIEAFDDQAVPKQTVTPLPGDHGGIQGKPLRDSRQITIRGIIGGNPCCLDEPMRVLKRIFRLGRTAGDTLTIGLSDLNFPGVGPHWTIAAMVSDSLLIQDTGQQSLVRWQVGLIAADPHYVGRAYAYTITEGYEVMGKTFPFTHPYTYGSLNFVNGLTVFLEGGADSKMSAIIRGPSANPVILNVTTGEYVAIEYTLSADDVLTIGEDNVVKLNGQFRNSLKSIGTRLPSLVPGVNEIVLIDDTSPLNDPSGPTAEIRYTTRDA